MSDLVIRSTNVPAEFEKQIEMARMFAESSLLPRHLQRNPANILVILDGARALDVPSFWAFQSMYVVEGKLALSAELMRALVVRAGHKFRILEHTNTSAKVSITRKDDPEFDFVSEFTIADARAAGLTNKGPWKSYPKAMLLARATSQAVRAHCPDVLFGVVYTPEELGAVVDDEGKVVVDNTGKVVIDSTATAGPVVDQDMVDRIAESVLNAPLKDAAQAYDMALRMKVTEEHHSTDSPGATLTALWMTRLGEALTGAKTTDDLRELWTAANGTQLLGLKLIESGRTLGEEIERLRIEFTSRPAVVDAEPIAEELPEAA